MKFKSLFVTVVCLLLLASTSFAADRYWVDVADVGSGYWTNTAHWSATLGGAGGASYPVSGDTAYIFGSASDNAATITMDANVTCNQIIGSWALYWSKYPITLNFNAKTVSLLNGGLNLVNNVTSIRTMDLTNANITVSSWQIPAAPAVTITTTGSTITLKIGTGQIYARFDDARTTPTYNNLVLDHSNVNFGYIYIPLYNNNLTFNAITNVAQTGITDHVDVEIGDKLKVYTLNCTNWAVTGSVANSVRYDIIGFGGATVPFIIKQTSGTVSLQNCTIIGCYAVGGAAFNSPLTSGNVDGGGNYGLVFSGSAGSPALTVMTQDISYPNIGNGAIMDIGTAYTVVQRGFVYKTGTTGDPIHTDSSAYDTGTFGVGGFYKALTLTGGTNYRVAAFAKDSNGTYVYGATIQAVGYAVSGYSISGTVSGAANAGVTISLAVTAIATTTTDSSGNYTFLGLANGNYTVTPSLPTYTFTPTASPVIVNGANVIKNFVAKSSGGVVPSNPSNARVPACGS